MPEFYVKKQVELVESVQASNREAAIRKAQAYSWEWTRAEQQAFITCDRLEDVRNEEEIRNKLGDVKERILQKPAHRYSRDQPVARALEWVLGVRDKIWGGVPVDPRKRQGDRRYKNETTNKN